MAWSPPHSLKPSRPASTSCARGGNVVDAAIGAALVQTAVDPQMCGIAGMGCLHVYLPGARGAHHDRLPWPRAGSRAHRHVAGPDRARGRRRLGLHPARPGQRDRLPGDLHADDAARVRYRARALGHARPGRAVAAGDRVLPSMASWCGPMSASSGIVPPQAGRDGNIGVVTRYPATRKIYTKSNGHPVRGRRAAAQSGPGAHLSPHRHAWRGGFL